MGLSAAGICASIVSMRGRREGRAPGCDRMRRRLGRRSNTDDRYRWRIGRGEALWEVCIWLARGARTVSARVDW